MDARVIIFPILSLLISVAAIVICVEIIRRFDAFYKDYSELKEQVVYMDVQLARRSNAPAERTPAPAEPARQGALQPTSSEQPA